MSEVIEFYTSPVSRGRVVHWMLEEVGAEYRPHLLDLAKGEHKRAEYLAINPMGKVPAIVHRGQLVTEVGAICMYLAEAFPAAGLAPPLGDPQRGAYLRWMFFSAATLEPALIDLALHAPQALIALRLELEAAALGLSDLIAKALELELRGRGVELEQRFAGSHDLTRALEHAEQARIDRRRERALGFRNDRARGIEADFNRPALDFRGAQVLEVDGGPQERK